jgi:hypothetical protein
MNHDRETQLSRALEAANEAVRRTENLVELLKHEPEISSEFALSSLHAVQEWIDEECANITEEEDDG